MTTLVRDGLELHYEVRGGSSRALLLPYLNFSWPDILDLDPFVERFTVVIASPRGFATSSRLLAAGLDRRGLPHAAFPGHDHEGMLAHLDEAVPTVLAWLDETRPG